MILQISILTYVINTSESKKLANKKGDKFYELEKNLSRSNRMNESCHLLIPSMGSNPSAQLTDF